MAGWLLAGFYCSSISCFQIFSRISRIFIWQAAADQSAAAGSIMNFLENRFLRRDGVGCVSARPKAAGPAGASSSSSASPPHAAYTLTLLYSQPGRGGAAGLLLVACSLPPMEPEPASSTFNALITGGNRGIGLQVARDLLAHMTASGRRCTVFLGCRDLSAGRELASQLLVADAASGGCTVEAVRVDITCAGSICDAVSFVEARTEQLHLLVNNAGIMPEAEAAGPAFSADAARATTQTNFEGTVGVTEAFLPLLLRAPSGSASVLSTSSGVGARTLGLVSEQHRQQLLAEDLDLVALRGCVNGILHALQADESHPYHKIPTVGYGVSKMAVNCYTQLLARRYPTLRVNACSPGFTNTDMCKHYTGSRVPKEVALGASVFLKAIFGDLGASQTGKFFKEASKAGTPLAEANAVIDTWVQ